MQKQYLTRLTNKSAANYSRMDLQGGVVLTTLTSRRGGLFFVLFGRLGAQSGQQLAHPSADRLAQLVQAAVPLARFLRRNIGQEQQLTGVKSSLFTIQLLRHNNRTEVWPWNQMAFMNEKMAQIRVKFFKKHCLKGQCHEKIWCRISI